MAITAAQYQSMRLAFRIMLSVEGVGPTDSDVLSFSSQLFADSSGAAALSTARNFLATEVLRTVLSAAIAPTDSNVSDFLTQLATDSGGATPMGLTKRYRSMRNALRAAMSGGGLNPSDADVLSYIAPFASGPAPLIAQITQASGCQLAFDTDYCPGAVDGSPVIAITNRSGSNAIFDAVNNWGHGATTLPVWRKTGWGRTQSCLYFANTGMRFTGTDIAGCVTGVGKLFHMLLIYQPLFEVSTPTTVNVTAGWCNSGGSQFVNGMTSWYQNPRTAGAVPQLLWQGKAAANVADGVRSNWVPTCFEMARSDTTHIRSTFNGRVSTPVAYANGTSIDADGVYVGAWANVTNDGIQSSQLVRAGFFWDHLLSAGELTTMYNYVRTYYRGFDWQLGLGAT